MSETQEIVDLFQNKYRILSDSLNDLNIKVCLLNLYLFIK
jgi:hypothetical protein